MMWSFGHGSGTAIPLLLLDDGLCDDSATGRVNDMWKRSETDEHPAPAIAEPRMTATPSPASREAATIGSSITIRGDISGEENLVVEGRVEGTVSLREYNVTVGAEGHIKADVHAMVIEVLGDTEGDLHAGDQVILRRSAKVKGNIDAPRVTLEDGCRFKGSIDMEAATDDGRGKEASRVSGLKSVGAGTGTPAEKVAPPAAGKPHAAGE